MASLMDYLNETRSAAGSSSNYSFFAAQSETGSESSMGGKSFFHTGDLTGHDKDKRFTEAVSFLIINYL